MLCNGIPIEYLAKSVDAQCNWCHRYAPNFSPAHTLGMMMKSGTKGHPEEGTCPMFKEMNNEEEA